MTLRNRIRVQATICKIAIQERTTPKRVRSAMQEALDEAWSTAWTPGNLHAQVAWQRLFPGGHKPSLEEAICSISGVVTRNK